jgi:hypothetical protein
MKAAAFTLVTCLAIGTSTVCSADDMVSGQKAAGAKIAFLLKDNYSNATLTITGPGDFHAQTSTKGGALALDLRQFGGVDDGTFTYQITAATDEKTKVRTTLDNGRSSREPTEVPKGATLSGTFLIVRGEIVMPDTSIPRRRDAGGQ